MKNKIDSRQVANRAFLRKLANQANFTTDSFNTIKNLLSAINAELSPAFELYPTNPLDRVLNIGGNFVSNPETSIRHTNQPINKQAPLFTSGSITLPSATGGTIVVSPSIVPNPILTISANSFIAGLIECDSLGNLSITLGAEAVSEALAIANFPGINSKAFQIGLLIIQSVSGVVQNVTGSTILQFSGGGGAGTGSGNGIKEPIPGYQWLEEDTFDVLKTATDSRVTSTNYTNAVQNLGKDLYRLSCDKSKTVASNSGTALSINSSPSFTVAVGDIAYVTSGARSGQWRRISAVGSQTSYTLDSAFTGGDASASDTLMISQAVWTVDLVNAGSASDKTRARDQFSGNITQLAIDYFDSLTAGDQIPDYVDAARVVVSASNDGLVSDTGVPVSNTFTTPFVRQAYPAQINDYVLNVSANYERLFLAFFCNPSNGSVTSGANLLGYEASFEAEDFVTNGGVLDSAYCYTDSSGTPVNCTVLAPVAGKSRIQFNWSYIPTINASTTDGTLRVTVDGKDIPRYLAGSTTDAYYKEIADPSTGIYDTIELHDNLSALNISVKVIRSEGVVDSANTNTTRIVSLESDRNVVSISSNYLISPTDGIVLMNCTGANKTATLPSAIGLAGKEITVKKIDSTSFFVTMLTSLGQTIDLESGGTIFIYGPQDDITFKSNGANWLVKNRYLNRQSAAMYLGSNQAISNATVTKVDFTAANDVNDNGIASPASDQITIKYTGRYDITGNLSYQANGAGARWLWIYINGIEKWGQIVPASNDFKPRLSVTMTNVLLNPGDIIEMYTWQNSSGGLILDASDSQSNILSVQRISRAGF